MNTVLWVVQILLVFVFGMVGTMKLTQPREKLVERMHFVRDVPLPIVRLIGLLEVLGSIGVVLPALTGILPRLTPLAACGLMLVMIGAMLTNFRRREYPAIGLNLVLLLLAGVAAYGRFVILPL